MFLNSKVIQIVHIRLLVAQILDTHKECTWILKHSSELFTMFLIQGEKKVVFQVGTVAQKKTTALEQDIMCWLQSASAHNSVPNC